VTRDEIIAEVAKRHGVLLGPDDPVLIEATMLEMHANACRERDDELLALPDEVSLRIAPVLARINALAAAGEQAASQPAAALSPAQIDKLGRQLATRCAAALEWRSTTIFCATLLAGTLAGGIIDRFLLAPPPDLSHLTCGIVADGRSACWFFTQTPPPVASSPATPPTGGRQ
jgi:hypothetical protein